MVLCYVRIHEWCDCCVINAIYTCDTRDQPPPQRVNVVQGSGIWRLSYYMTPGHIYTYKRNMQPRKRGN